ncbi:MAG: rRNA pseudouridine synthase [Rhodospirillales bacterium]|nr:rRNA pseudouridine synthase [Rhodospirillales bacterium]
MAEEKAERIAKVLARAGLCSRREAERWIADGRVAVNKKVLVTPAVTVTSRDRIVVDGKLLPEAEQTKLWRYHKPTGLLTSHGDPRGRNTVFAALPSHMGRVISVGRLDYNSEGLLLLTNDGELARKLEMPATGWLRRYRVRVHGRVDEAQLERLAKGVEVEGVRYGPVEARLDKVQRANAWLTVSLREGKNREVRKIMEHLGLDVNRLIRTSYGPFQLGNLSSGEVSQVPAKALREQLGIDQNKVETVEKKKPAAKPRRVR